MLSEKNPVSQESLTCKFFDHLQKLHVSHMCIVHDLSTKLHGMNVTKSRAQSSNFGIGLIVSTKGATHSKKINPPGLKITWFCNHMPTIARCCEALQLTSVEPKVYQFQFMPLHQHAVCPPLPSSSSLRISPMPLVELQYRDHEINWIWTVYMKHSFQIRQPYIDFDIPVVPHAGQYLRLSFYRCELGSPQRSTREWMGYG